MRHPGDGQLHDSTRLRRTATVLMWIVTATIVGATALLTRLPSIVDDQAAGRVPGDAIEEAWLEVLAVGLLSVPVALVVAIVLSTWSRRVLLRAEATSGRDLRSDRVAVTWLIPICNLWSPFTHLASAADTAGTSTRPVARWRAGWIGAVMLAIGSPLTVGVFDIDDRTAAMLLLYSSAALAIVCASTAWLAGRAMAQLENAVR